MAASEGDVYSRILARITVAILLIGGAGTVALAVTRGWRFALGFFLGACISYVSFWRWRKVVDSLGGDAPRPRRIGAMMLRFAALVAAAYVIVNYLEVNPVAVLLGLLVSAAAVVVSIVLELIYART